jgi:hypothetical protein
MATPIEEERCVLTFWLKQTISQPFLLLAIRERTQGLERRGCRLSSPSRRRTSASGSQGQQLLLPMPPASNPIRQLRSVSASGPTSQAGPSSVGPSARSAAQWARRERERQQRLLGIIPGPSLPAESSNSQLSARSAAQRARWERKRQQRLLGGDLPPTPPPSNRRAGHRKR